VRKVRKAAARRPPWMRNADRPRGVSSRLLRAYLAGKACSIEFSELNGVHEFNLRLADIDDSGSARLNVLALDIHTGSLCLGVSLGLIVGANASFEGLAAGGHTGVLDADVDALGEDAATDALVHNDTEGVCRHVEDSARLAVVELVRHASVDGAVRDNIHVVTLPVRNQVLAQGDCAVVSETSGKEMSRASSKTESVGHFSFKPSKYLI